MAGLPLHHHTASIRKTFIMQILVVLWDLLFLEGSSILLKAIIVLIDELEPTILACKDISIASFT